MSENNGKKLVALLNCRAVMYFAGTGGIHTFDYGRTLEVGKDDLLIGLVIDRLDPALSSLEVEAGKVQFIYADTVVEKSPEKATVEGSALEQLDAEGEDKTVVKKVATKK